MTINMTELSWGQRFSVMSHYQLSDNETIEVFGISRDELKTAKSLFDQQVLREDPNFDVGQFTEILGRSPQTPVQARIANHPASKSRSPSTRKKRGKKGNKILTAFKSITTDPVTVESVMATYGVSKAVLRQSKRFDTTGLGDIHVHKDVNTKVLMIWRDETDTGEDHNNAG